MKQPSFQNRTHEAFGSSPRQVERFSARPQTTHIPMGPGQNSVDNEPLPAAKHLPTLIATQSPWICMRCVGSKASSFSMFFLSRLAWETTETSARRFWPTQIQRAPWCRLMTICWPYSHNWNLVNRTILIEPFILLLRHENITKTKLISSHIKALGQPSNPSLWHLPFWIPSLVRSTCRSSCRRQKGTHQQTCFRKSRGTSTHPVYLDSMSAAPNQKLCLLKIRRLRNKGPPDSWPRIQPRPTLVEEYGKGIVDTYPRFLEQGRLESD